MIRRPVPLLALAAMFAAVASCAPSARQDASSAAAAKARPEDDRAASQVRRKAEMLEAGARAREDAARDIARSDGHAARSAAGH